MGGRGTNVAPRGQQTQLQHQHHHHQHHNGVKSPKRRSGPKSKRRSKTPLTQYQVIKPNHFADHRPAYADPLSFSRPNKLDLKGTSFFITVEF